MTRFLGTWLVSFLVIAVLAFIGAQVDLIFNSFLRNIEPNWWNVFTTEHGPTIALLYFPALFWVLVGLVSAIVAGMFSSN